MDTKALQTALISLGYDVGPAGADGVMGRRTIAAITKFQKDAGLPIRYPGTVGPITIGALNARTVAGAPTISTENVLPPWYVEARRKIGLQEVLHNKSLREYLKSDGKTLGDPAKLPWCGDFMETVIALTLPLEPMIENPYYALNWKKFGVAVPAGLVPLGAIAPFERRVGGKLVGGHIGQIVGHDKTHYHVLGGNQSNTITIARIAKDRLSGSLRWPATYILPTESLPFSTINATITTNEA